MRFNEDRGLNAERGLTRVRRVAHSFAGILRTRYPRFLLGLPLAPGEIPVFIYHDVEAARFANDLQFLHANGYRTLGLDEFIAISAMKSGRTGKCVLLTFDDARSNFYETALPVLWAFDARATLFVPSYWMAPSPADAASGGLFMRWEQVRACVESGLVDVQSHAHRHALVYTSGRLIGFANPRTLARYDIYDWPMRYTPEGDKLGRPALGSPVYSATPLLSARRRFLESPALTKACTRLVEQSGGAAFFDRVDWAAKLRRVHAEKAAEHLGHFIGQREFHRLVASEFEKARAAFRSHLGYSPTSLAFPWMLGSPLSLELARYCGIGAAFGGAVEYRRARDRRLPMPVFGRLKADWLPLLPGTGRASFLSIAAKKIAGLSKIQHLAH